jgi:hypothetical protein
MTELNSIINGTEIPFKLDSVQRGYSKLYGDKIESSYRSTHQFDAIANANRNTYRRPEGILAPSVPFGNSPEFLWGQSVEPVKHGGYRPSGSNIDGNTIPKAVIQKTNIDLGGERAAERYIAKNSFIRYEA